MRFLVRDMELREEGRLTLIFQRVTLVKHTRLTNALQSAYFISSWKGIFQLPRHNALFYTDVIAYRLQAVKQAITIGSEADLLAYYGEKSGVQKGQDW